MRNLPKITLHHLMINNKKMIGLQFFPNKVVQAMIKSWGIAKWSKDHNMAYIPNNKTNLNKVINDFRGVAWISWKHFSNKNKSKAKSNLIIDYQSLVKNIDLGPCPKSYLNKLIAKNYALNTCKIYISMFKKFLYDLSPTPLSKITENDISEYMTKLAANDRSHAFLNQMINAIKFYFEIVLGMPNRFYELDRPFKANTLPKVVSKSEVAALLKHITNEKQKTMVSLLYSTGIRANELFNLKINDINSKRMLVFVKNAKGRKDRYVPLSQNALKQLRTYYIKYKPVNFLFEGQKGGKYSLTSLNKIIKTAAIKAGIKVKVTSHILRHSFASHLLESGVDLRVIQTILGHYSIKTTEIYTHISKKQINNFENPLDSNTFRDINKNE